MNKDKAIGFGIGLLVGAAIGGVIALLYAPKTGKETRKLIKDKATEVVDTVKEVVDTVKEETAGVINTVKDAAGEARQKGQAAVKSLKS